MTEQPKPIQQILTSTLTGVTAGAVTATAASVRWPGAAARFDWQPLLVLLCAALVVVWALRAHATAVSAVGRPSGLGAIVSAVTAAAMFACTVHVAYAPWTWGVFVLGAVTVAVAVVAPRTGPVLFGCLTASALFGVYAWSGDSWGPQLLVCTATILIIGGMAVIAPLFDRRGGSAGFVVSWVVVAGLTAVLLPSTALAAGTHSYVGRQWEQRPIEAATTRQSIGLADGDDAVFNGRRTGAVDRDGRVAVLTTTIPNKVVLSMRDTEGAWTHVNVSTPFLRPDGGDLLLSDLAGSGQVSGLRAALAGASPQTVPGFGWVGNTWPSMAFSGEDLYLVSNEGVFRASASGIEFVANPWDTPAAQRRLAINGRGEAVVLSYYGSLGESGYSATVETVDLGTGELGRIDFDSGIPATRDRAAVPSTQEAAPGQHRVVGVSVLPDDSFVTWIGPAVVRFTPQGERHTLLTTAWPEPVTDFRVTGDMLAMVIESTLHLIRYSYHDDRMEFVLDSAGQMAADHVLVGDSSAVRPCGTASTRIPRIPTGDIHVANGGPGAPSVVMTAGPGCTGGVWRNEAGDSEWELLNSTQNLYRESGRVDTTGLIYAPAVLDGTVRVLGKTPFGETEISDGVSTFAMSFPSTGEERAMWTDRVVGTARAGGTAWLLARGRGAETTDEMAEASLFRRMSDGNWDRVVSAPGATGITAVGDATLVISTCRKVHTVDAAQLVATAEAGGDSAALFRTVAELPTKWEGDDGCSVVPAANDENVGAKTGFVHTIVADPRAPDRIVLAQSVLLPGDRWRHVVSGMDTGTGAVTPIPGADLTGMGLVPVDLAMRADGALCVAAMDSRGAGVLVHIADSVVRRVRFDEDIQPNGCAWTEDGVFVTDAVTGNGYTVRTSGRHGF